MSLEKLAASKHCECAEAMPINRRFKEIDRQMDNTTDLLGYVYVIHAIGTNRIKIGYTTDLNGRLKGLQTGSPFPLQMLANWPGTKAREQRVHRYLSQFRKVGEWFEVPPFTVGYQIWKLITTGEVTGQIAKGGLRHHFSGQSVIASSSGQNARVSQYPATPDGFEWRRDGDGANLMRRWYVRDDLTRKNIRRRAYCGRISRSEIERLLLLSESDQVEAIRQIAQSYVSVADRKRQAVS